MYYIYMTAQLRYLTLTLGQGAESGDECTNPFMSSFAGVKRNIGKHSTLY